MSGRSAPALPSFHLASCSRRRPKGCRGAHSRAIDWQWRRGAFSYRLYCPPTLSYCTRPPLRALGKASLVPFFLYIPISPHIIISTHCCPQKITIYTSLYTNITFNGYPQIPAQDEINTRAVADRSPRAARDSSLVSWVLDRKIDAVFLSTRLTTGRK
jgi:hypothetical protein